MKKHTPKEIINSFKELIVVNIVQDRYLKRMSEINPYFNDVEELLYNAKEFLSILDKKEENEMSININEIINKFKTYGYEV